VLSGMQPIRKSADSARLEIAVYDPARAHPQSSIQTRQQRPPRPAGLAEDCHSAEQTNQLRQAYRCPTILLSRSKKGQQQAVQSRQQQEQQQRQDTVAHLNADGSCVIGQVRHRS
jgi:hypothetical protein